MGQVIISDDGELIEAVEVPTDSTESPDDQKPKEKRSRIQRYVYSGIGRGIGMGIVAVVAIGLIALVSHVQHQFAIGEWKLPQIIPTAEPITAPLAPTDLGSLIGETANLFNCFVPLLIALLIIGIAMTIAKSALTVIKE